MNIVKKLQQAGLILGTLGVLGFMGIVWLMIYGNLAGNLGFAANSQGWNDTLAVINNITAGFKTFFGFSNTFFTIAAIVVLITMFVGLIGLVVLIAKSFNNSSRGSGDGFSYD